MERQAPISIICVTNRPGAVDYLKTQLDKQTFQGFEVIIADDGGNKKRYDQQFVPRQKEVGDVWNLNKAYNDCLDKVKGELIVFIQDFIEIPANGLARFWEVYQIVPDLITGVGHKYENKKIVETDDRVAGNRGLNESDWTYYELNWASCPTSIASRFDEDMDTHYGGENQIFALKTGAKVWIDRSNECRGLSQQECGGRPNDWEEKHANKGFLNTKIQQYI